MIDGGDGTDVVNAAATAADQTIKPALANIETLTVELTSVDTKDLTIDLSDASSVTSLTVTAPDTAADDTDLLIKGVALTDAVNLSTSYASSNSLTKATITYSGTTGTADSAEFSASGNISDVIVAGVESVTLNGTSFSGTLTVANATTVSVNALGGAKKTTTIADIAQSTAKLATLNLGGDGAKLDVDAADIDFKGDAVVNITNTGTTIIAIDNLSAATNSLTVTGGEGKDQVDIDQVAQGTIVVSTGAGDDTITIDGGDVTINAGAGDDTLVADLSKVTKDDSIDLGAGTDTVTVTDATLNISDAALLLYVQNEEILKTTATASVTIDANAFSSVSNFMVAGADPTATAAASGAGADSVTLTDVENTDVFWFTADRFGEDGNTSGSGGHGVAATAALDNGTNVLSLQLIGGLAGADGIDINGGDLATTGSDGAAISAAQFESLNINLTDYNLDASAATVASHVLTGGATADAVTVGTNATVTVTGAGNLTMNTVKGTNVTIDASALAGKLVVTAPDGNVTIKGGSGKNDLNGGAGIDTIIGGANDDDIDGKAGVDIMTGGAGTDTFVTTTASSATTAVQDKITDYETGLEGDVINFTSDGAVIAAKASTDVSGAIGGSGAVAGDTLTASVANGVITLAGNATSKIDSVAEIIDIFELVDTSSTEEFGVIEMGGDTYVIGIDASDDVLDVVQLVGVTGVATVGLTAASDVTVS